MGLILLVGSYVWGCVSNQMKLLSSQMKPLRSQSTDQDLAYCQELTLRHAKSFSAGIRFFPERIRESTYALYGFVRVPDDIVDEGGLSDEEALEALNRWRDDWRQTLRTGQSPHPAQRAFLKVLMRHELPPEWAEDFLAAMIQDTQKKTYATYSELEGYMHGSATVVGYIMARLCGASDAGLPAARALAEAFQLTNFLRDVASDWSERGRIYLPGEDLRRFGLSLDTIAEGRCSAAWEQLMRFEMDRARALYRVARQGFTHLQPDCRFGVALAADLYEAILDKIERANYDVFSGRVRLSRPEKTAILVKARLSHCRPLLYKDGTLTERKLKEQ